MQFNVRPATIHQCEVRQWCISKFSWNHSSFATPPNLHRQSVRQRHRTEWKHHDFQINNKSPLARLTTICNHIPRFQKSRIWIFAVCRSNLWSQLYCSIHRYSRSHVEEPWYYNHDSQAANLLRHSLCSNTAALLPVPVSPPHAINSLQLQSSNAVKLPYLHNRIAFYHATLFSPLISTWINATDAEYLHSFPNLTSKQIRSYRPHSEATTLGHQHAQRSNLRSTRKTLPAFNATSQSPQPMHIIPDDEPEPLTYKKVLQTAPSTLKPMQPAYQERPGHRTHHVYAECETITGKVGSDQTGCFIIPSTTGNNYIFVLYDYDSNSIHAEPIPNRKQESIKNAYEKVLRLLQRRGLRPKLHRLDNEASQLLKDFMTDEDVDHQLTPAGLHRRNWAERAIQIFKNHFIAGLCSTHPDCPLNLWDQLLPQAQPLPPIVPPPAPPTQRQSTRILRPTTKVKENSQINFITTTVKLPPKLQFILDREIKRASDPTIHPLMKLHAVPNAETGKLEEYRTLLKGVDKILWEQGCSKEVARLAQGRKDGSVKGTETLHFIDADQERYLLTFASVPTTVPKKKILIAFDGPSVAI